jgi:hypothetical protein
MINNTRQLFIFVSIYLFMMLAVIGAAAIIGESESVQPMRYLFAGEPVDIEQDVIRELIQYFNPRLTKEKQLKISELIMDKAKKCNFEPFFVAGVIATESSFRPGVVSPCQARGLMQITDSVSLMMDVENPFDVEQNITAGTKYLKMLKQQFVKEELILAAYSAGPTRVARLRRIPRIRETIHYVKRVIRLHEKLDSMFQAKLKKSFDGICISLMAWAGYAPAKTGSKLFARDSGMLINPLDCDGPRRLFIIKA